MLLFVFLFVSCKKEKIITPNQAFIQEMEAVADSIVQHANVPGIAAFAVDHKLGIDWLYTIGFSDVPNKIPMNGDHIFRIASNTKTMTGTVLLQLADEGRLSLGGSALRLFP